MKNIALIMIPSLLIILSGCSQQDISKFAEKAIENPQVCDSLDYSGTPFNPDVCYSFVAIQRQEIDLCEKVIDAEAKKGCYYNIREMLGFTGLSDCKEIPEFSPKVPCYQTIAKGITDIEECNKFPDDYRYVCYYEFAARTKDVSICNKYFKPLTPPDIQEQIKKFTTEAKSEGKPINEDFRPFDYVYDTDRHSGCYDFVAKAAKQSNLCLSPGCVHYVARTVNNPRICFDIKDLSFVGSGYYDLDNELDYCIVSVIAQPGYDTVDFCMQVKNEGQRNACFREIATRTGNIKLCKNINVSDKSTTTVTRCYIDGEGNKQCTEGEQQTSYLDKTEEYKINNCYLNIAKDHPEKCNDAAEDSMKLRNACYYAISGATNNPSICQNIVIPKIDDVTCEDYLNNYGLVATPEKP